jgi:hypothetical protein
VAAAERQIGGRFQFKTVAFPLAVGGGRLPAGGNVVMVFAKDAERQKAAWKYVKFTTGPVGQTTMVNSTRYMSGNEIAVKTPDLLGAFYTRSPNHLTSTQQLPLLTGASFPGDNSLKIIEVIKHHMESLVTGKRTAEQVMPEQMCPIFCQSAATSWRSNERGGTQSGSHACALGASLGGLSSVDCRTGRARWIIQPCVLRSRSACRSSACQAGDDVVARVHVRSEAEKLGQNIKLPPETAI